jgi:hypothetical protein
MSRLDALLGTGMALLLTGIAVTPRTVQAQADRGYEVGIQGLTLLQDPVWLGGAMYGAWRPGGGVRLGLTIGAGSLDGRFSGRGELLAHFLLSPGRRRGVGLYGIGGIAGVAGPRDQGYLILGLGLEQAPGSRSGWAIEAGVGGGVRVAVGWRWRRLAPARTP